MAIRSPSALCTKRSPVDVIRLPVIVASQSNRYRRYRMGRPCPDLRWHVKNALLERLAGLALAFDAPARVEVAHPLGVADLLDVVDGDVQLAAEAPRTRVTACPASGPLAIRRHKHHRDVGDGGLGLDEGLDTLVRADPVLEVLEIGGGVGA